MLWINEYLFTKLKHNKNNYWLRYNICQALCGFKGIKYNKIVYDFIHLNILTVPLY